MKRAPRRVWVVVFPGSELLDVSGPWAVLGQTNRLIGYDAYDLHLVTPAGGAVRTRLGLSLAGARSLAQAARLGRPDTLIVAGCASQEPLPGPQLALARWLRAQHRLRPIPRLVTICTGAFVLGHAGLLDGRRATTHWKFIGEMRRRFPRAEIVADEIFVHDGRIWTSAGGTAGIDLTLALVEEDHGHAVAMTVAKHLVLFLRRSGGQAQFSEALKRQEREPPKLHDVTAFVLERLDRALPVEKLARGLGMSARTLSRWCRHELQESPAALVRRLRLEEACRLIAETALPLKEVAARTGLGDTSTLWRAFTRRLGVTPARYRDRFAARALAAAA